MKQVLPGYIIYPVSVGGMDEADGHGGVSGQDLVSFREKIAHILAVDHWISGKS